MHFIHSGCQDANLALVQYSDFGNRATLDHCRVTDPNIQRHLPFWWGNHPNWGSNGHFSPGYKHSGSLLTPTSSSFSRWGRLRMKSFRNELLVILGGMLKVKAEGRPLIHYQSTPHQTLLAIPNFLGQDSESTCFGVRIPEQPPGLDVIPDLPRQKLFVL